LGSRLVPALLLALFAWAYWTTVVDVKHHWDQDPLYSHGYLVPGFALVLLWLRKGMLKGQDLTPSLWGPALVALAAAMRIVPLRYGFTVTDRYSILPGLAGLVLGLGGWPAFRWSWPGIAFLLFMLHLPAGVDQWLAGPLQHAATVASTNVLQTLGFFAVSEGNTILLSDSELNVAEACSGLNMLVTFIAMTTAVAILVRRSLLQRLLIVASSLPLAVMCNVARISLTGAASEIPGLGQKAHDWAGLFMIVLGLALLWLELAILARLFTPAGARRPPLPGLPGVSAPSVDPKAVQPAARMSAGVAGH
jgi:exosortase